MPRGSAHAPQITPLPVQQRQAGWAQHSEVERKKPSVRAAHVSPGNQISERSDQGVISDESGPLRFLTNPAQEEALLFVGWSVWHESFGERKQSFDEAWDG